jgi:hypothetical protein
VRELEDELGGALFEPHVKRFFNSIMLSRQRARQAAARSVD